MKLANVAAMLLLWMGMVRTVSAQNIHTDSIYEAYQQFKMDNRHLKIEQWRNHKKQTLQAQLEKLPKEVRQIFIARGEKVLKQQWPVLTASGFLEFTRTGNRANFEKPYKTRREMLKDLVIAEILEKSGRFLPMITDGIWMICEESTWSLPATLDVDQRNFGLPEVNNPIVDLCVVQTSVLLSWTKFLLSNQLEEVNSKLIPRIDFEIRQRVISPFLNRDDLWWMGFTGRKPNNWNIYCNYYLLVTAALSSESHKIKELVVDKTIKSAQYFLASYPNDGGCDEGPSYWNMAGGTFGMFVKMLSDISEQQLDFKAHRKIHNMGTYIHKVHIDGNYFVNFADASTLVSTDPAKVFAFATLFKDEQLKSFAAYFFQQKWYQHHEIQSDEINVFINNVAIVEALLQAKPATPMSKSSWLPDLEVLTARQQTGSAKGLFFAAKGGHNAESHNHNDVGNFVLYLDGKPALVDIGVGTYTKDTFNENRWQIWNIRSLWHNCPLINGVEQQNGRQFAATNALFKPGSIKDVFSLNIEKAYPTEADVQEWNRTFILDRKTQTLSLTEKYALKKFHQAQELSFISHWPVKKVKEGVLQLQMSPSPRTIELRYDPTQLEFALATQVLADPKLSGHWGTALHRLILKTKQQNLAEHIEVKFSIVTP